MADYIDRSPPHNQEAEQAVLGALILDNSVVDLVAGIVKPGDFYTTAHQAIAEAIYRLRNAGTVADVVTVREAVGDRLDEVGGFGYVLDLIDGMATTAHAEYHARIIRDAAVLRNLIRAGSAIVALGFEVGDAPVAVSRALGILEAVDAGGDEEDLFRADVLTHAFHADLEERQKRCGVETGLLSTGFYDLDRRLTGFRRSSLNILAARPAIGKTALALNFLKHIAPHHEVLVFSLEMDKEELQRRLMSDLADVDSKKMERGNLDADEWARVAKATGVLAEMRYTIRDKSNLTVADVRRALNRLKARGRLPKFVIIDYLQLMVGTGGKRDENRTQELTGISNGLKRVAREFGVRILALSQLSREVEKRPNKRPQLSDLRESGAIEADADLVMFLYRDDYYAEQEHRASTAPGTAEVIIAKHRHGPVGTEYLKFEANRTRFCDYTTWKNPHDLQETTL